MTGAVHFVKSRDHRAVETVCGVIAVQHGPGSIKTTVWNDYTCPDCLRIRPVEAVRKLRGVKRRSQLVAT